MTMRSRRPSPTVDRPSTGPPPRREGCAFGESSWDGGRSEIWESTTGDEREDVYDTRERDRPALVRRRRDRPDAGAARVADRARPRGQAQADVFAQPGCG